MPKGEKHVTRCLGCDDGILLKNCIECVRDELYLVPPSNHCHICKQALYPRPPHKLCRDCESRLYAGEQFVDEVVVISYYRYPLDPWLWRYKATGDSNERIPELQRPLGALLWYTITRTIDRIEGLHGRIDFVTWHPSTKPTRSAVGDHAVGALVKYARSGIFRRSEPAGIPRPVLETLRFKDDSLEPQHRASSVKRVLDESSYVVVNGEAVQHSGILLVDDVYKRGEHLNAAAAALKKAGARAVIGLVLGRTLYVEKAGALPTHRGQAIWTPQKVVVNGPYNGSDGDENDDLPF